MPTSTSYGPFPEGVARLSKVGGPQLSLGGKTTYEDEYSFVLPPGTRPNPSAITGLPALGDALSGVAGFVAVRISFEQPDAASRTWIARVAYEPGGKAEAAAGGHSDFDKHWGMRSVMADFVQDANNGKAVANSADEPFDSVPQREMLLPTLSFRRITSVAPAGIMEYNGSVNDARITVMGVAFEPHCARIRFDASRVEDGSSAGKYEYQFTIDAAANLYKESTATGGDPEDIGWDMSFLDCGYTCYDENGQRRPILIEDDEGNKVRPQMPQLLCAGSFLEERGNAYFLRFAPYPAKSWTSLHLPTA